MEYNLEIDENQKLWFISDLHFNHRKLTQLDENKFEIARPFNTIEEMNNTIFSNWQNTVKPEDIVIFAGDLIMNTPMSKIVEEVNKWFFPLNGFKIWLKGNHDGMIIKNLIKRNFSFNDISLHRNYLYFKYKNKDIFIQHYEYQNFDEYSKKLDIEKTLFVHGHTHSNEKVSYIGNRKLHNVCFEARINPVSFEELIEE
jgi:calcineurin-like phosphoesterase family protein